MFAKLAFLLLPENLFQGRPTERLLRVSGWTYLCGVLVSLILFLIAHPQYDHRVHLVSAAIFLFSYASVRIGVINYTWIKFGALWSLLEVIYITVHTGGINSPAMVWLSIIGVVAILFFNRKATQISIAILFSIYIYFYIAGQKAWVANDVAFVPESIAWAFTYKASVMVMVFLGALATDWMYAHLLEEIDTHNKNLENTQQKIMRAQSHKDEFIASIGHELRTPMNAILGFNGILRQELAANPADVHTVDLIKSSTEQLLQLVNNILDFSQLQANRVQLSSEKFLITQLVHEVTSLYLPRAQQKNLLLKMDVSAVEGTWATGDKQRIKQILTSLTDNALKFTTQGEIHIRVLLQKDHVHFEVQDSGIGIAPEKQRQIFQRFEQANLETSRQYGGAGLGLAIADRLVKCMGGQIGVQSNGKQGATFWFDVPLPIEHTADTQALSNQRTNWNKTTLNILLVDDNAVNLMVAKLMLTKCFPNCRVTEAVSGKAALEALAHNAYDLVLMDVVMPDMDGPTATQTIRQLQGVAYSSVPIMAITANTHPLDRDRYLAAGMNDVIHKPLDAEAMASQIIEVLNQRKGNAAA